MIASDHRKQAVSRIRLPRTKRQALLGCMGGRCFVTVLAIILCGLLVWFALARREHEPAYNGRDLSQWLAILEPGWNSGSGVPASEEAAAAVLKMGTNSLPFLLKWIRYEVRPMWGPFDLGRGDAFVRATRARDAFRILGSNAIPAIEELTAIMNDPHANWGRQRATEALGYIGAAGLPPLVSALGKTNSPRHLITASLLEMIEAGVNVEPAVPGLLLCLKDADGTMQQAAAEVLEKLAENPNMLGPILTNNLSSPDVRIRLAAVEFMSSLEKQLQSFSPAIERALDDPDLAVRRAATNALRKIDPR